jgi:hypothetical protein
MADRLAPDTVAVPADGIRAAKNRDGHPAHLMICASSMTMLSRPSGVMI